MRPNIIIPAFFLIALAGCTHTHPQTARVPACPIRMAAGPTFGGAGVVTKLLSQAEAMKLLSHTQVTVGRPIDSAYVNNQRVLIRAQDGKVSTVLIPYDMKVVVGDTIEFQTGYVTSLQLCTYVPSLATRKMLSF